MKNTSNSFRALPVCLLPADERIKKTKPARGTRLQRVQSNSNLSLRQGVVTFSTIVSRV
jgi:hypothetical protein